MALKFVCLLLVCILALKVIGEGQYVRQSPEAPLPPPTQQSPCNCPFNYEPVCGIDGQLYPNKCVLLCAIKSRYTNWTTFLNENPKYEYLLIGSGCPAQPYYEPAIFPANFPPPGPLPPFHY